MVASEFPRFSEIDYDTQDNVVAVILGVEVCETRAGNHYLNAPGPGLAFEVVTHRGPQAYAMTCGHAVRRGEAYVWWRQEHLAFDLHCAEQLLPGPCCRAFNSECGCDSCMPSD